MNGLSFAIMILLIAGLTMDMGGMFDEVRYRTKKYMYAGGLGAFAIATVFAVF